MSSRKVLAAIGILVLLLAGCSEESRGEVSDRLDDRSSTTQAEEGSGDTEAAPEPEPTPETEPEPTPETEPEPAPAPEPEPDDGEGISSRTLGLIALAGFFVIVLAFVVGRGRRGTPSAASPQQTPPAGQSPQPAPAPTPPPGGGAWAERARLLYADGRWIHDNADLALAEWRAGLHEKEPSASRLQQVSSEFDQRVSIAMNAVYELEGGAVSAGQREAARGVGVAVRAVQSAFERYVASRRDADAATTEPGQDYQIRLLEARSVLATALDHLVSLQ